jgi:Pyridine nucleotide-disulphide oxidoreductase
MCEEQLMTSSNHQPVWVDDPDAAPTSRSGLPVVVIGAGPVGLAAATHLLDRGLEPLVLEAGPQVGAAIAQWRHVRLFSPWCLALDPVSTRLLDQAGWTGPIPTPYPPAPTCWSTTWTPWPPCPPWPVASASIRGWWRWPVTSWTRSAALAVAGFPSWSEFATATASSVTSERGR